MQDPEAAKLPFLVRDMLRFEGAAAFALQIRTQSSVAGTIFIRGFTREGVFTFKHTTTNDGTVQTSTFRIPDVPILVSLTDDLAAFKQGDCVATLNLTENGDVVYVLTSGFVYAQKGISYPNNQLHDVMPGRGAIKTYTSANPAAGDELSLTVPTGRIWRILALNFQLVASATVANRRVRVRLQTNVGLDIAVFGVTDQTASQTMNYSFAQVGVISDEVDNTRIQIALPQEIYLGQDDFLGTDTINLQSGDNYSVMNVLVEEFFATPL